MAWSRTAYYGSRREMKAGIGRLAASEWAVESVTPLPGGSRQVVLAQRAQRAASQVAGRGERWRRMLA